ncbi:MAG TPA: FadR/GntR family transcriptional regulator [Chloroflexota bacterium]|nr:FadR/GntR family transcriptional regulator [Chloroflexota bacterium]
MDTALSPLRGELLYEAIQERIKRHIIEARLTPGDPLPTEAELARLLGVGRNSLREAVKALQTLGIVEIRHGHGMFVGNLSLDHLTEGLAMRILVEFNRDLHTVREMLELRDLLETAMVCRLAGHLTPEQQIELEACVADMEDRAARGETIAAADRSFHDALYRPLNNALILQLLNVFWDVFLAIEDQLPPRPIPQTETAAHHRRILDLLITGDGPGAAQVLSDDFRFNQAWYADLNERESTSRD